MITVSQIVDAFNSMLGWPYASPGYNDSRGIDCSGAFVYAYNLYGERIYHGSNRMIRVYCNNVMPASSARLEKGMAIFKSRTNLDGMKAEYKPGGRYYDPSLPNDYYHVGLITNVSPLEIVNATTPRVLISQRLSDWSDVAFLNAVDYSDAGDGGDDDDDGGGGGGGGQPEYNAYTVAEQGGTVNLRESPDTRARILARVPLGRRVLAGDEASGWRPVRYGATEGYMMSEFLVLPC